MRELNDYEISILGRGARDGGVVIGTDVFSASVEDIAPEDMDWRHVVLRYENLTAPMNGYSILMDMEAKDSDGALIELLVLGDKNGRPYEIEIHRWDGKPIQVLPMAEVWVTRAQ